MKTAVYYRIFSDTQPQGIACGTFSSKELAQEYIDAEYARYKTIENKENRDYWMTYVNGLKINKVIELTEQV